MAVMRRPISWTSSMAKPFNGNWTTDIIIIIIINVCLACRDRWRCRACVPPRTSPRAVASDVCTWRTAAVTLFIECDQTAARRCGPSRTNRPRWRSPVLPAPKYRTPPATYWWRSQQVGSFESTRQRAVYCARSLLNRTSVLKPRFIHSFIHSFINCTLSVQEWSAPAVSKPLPSFIFIIIIFIIIIIAWVIYSTHQLQ